MAMQANAKNASFMVPAGRRLSRVDSKTLRASFKGESSDEMEAVMRNLARKDDKIKYNRRMRMVLAGSVAVMVIMVGAMLGVTMGANEATKESHISRANTMVGLDGNPVTTAKDTSYVKLSELSRASLEYLSNLEDITLAAKGKVHQFRVTGYSLHDSDNLDLHTSTSTVIKIQCGAIRIVWEAGELEDADEMHKEAAGAARQLKAMSAAELQAHYVAHASTESRKLAASNPLQGLAAFFGGMAKSSSSSQLYGALAPVSGCKRPAAIISIVRPTIPVHSKWTVQVNAATLDAKTNTADKLQDDTWYMSWDQTTSPSIRFESPLEECKKSVTVDANGAISTWMEFDARTCMTTGKVDTTCPSAKILKEGNMANCDAYKAFMESSSTAIMAAQNGVQTDCTEEKKPASTGDIPNQVRILEAHTDGSATWQFGGFVMDVDATGTPTAIVDETAGKKFVVTKVEAFKSIDNVELFKGCKSSPGKQTAEIAKTEGGKRRLGWMTDLQAWASDTNWCGSGTDIPNVPCPSAANGNDFNADKACRKHDHGRKHQSALGGLGVKLECLVDKTLATTANNWAATAIFGARGLANMWGCDNYEYKNHRGHYWHWGGCGWRGCPGWQRRAHGSTWAWTTANGWGRYNNVRSGPGGGWKVPGSSEQADPKGCGPL